MGPLSRLARAAEPMGAWPGVPSREDTTGVMTFWTLSEPSKPIAKFVLSELCMKNPLTSA
jgi:hypothetical protein